MTRRMSCGGSHGKRFKRKVLADSVKCVRSTVEELTIPCKVGTSLGSSSSRLFIYLFPYLLICLFVCLFNGCVGSSPPCEGPLQLWQAGASLVAEHRLQTRRLSNCGSRAQLLRGMWNLPRPGLEPVSPALAGRFSTTMPPGKPLISIIYKNFTLDYSILFNKYLLSCILTVVGLYKRGRKCFKVICLYK